MLRQATRMLSPVTTMLMSKAPPFTIEIMLAAIVITIPAIAVPMIVATAGLPP